MTTPATWDDMRWTVYSAAGGWWWIEMWQPGGVSVVSRCHRQLWAAMADAARQLGMPA